MDEKEKAKLNKELGYDPMDKFKDIDYWAGNVLDMSKSFDEYIDSLTKQ